MSIIPLNFVGIKDGVFVTTNESGLKDTLEAVGRVQAVGDTIIGVSGFCVLNIAAVRLLNSQNTLKNIVIIDRNDRVQIFWQDVSEIIKKSQTRQQCFDAIGENIIKMKDEYVLDQSSDSFDRCGLLEYEISENLSWLSDDRRFFLIKKIFDENKFYFFRLDFSKPLSFAPFLYNYRVANFKTDVIYLSNVHEYLDDDELDIYANIVKYLLSNNTILIDTYPREASTEMLSQRVRQYDDIDDKKEFILENRDTAKFSFPETHKIHRAASILTRLKCG